MSQSPSLTKIFFLPAALILTAIATTTLLRRLHKPPPPRRPIPPANPFKAADHANDRKYHLLLAATGSVATIKLPLIVSALSKHQNRLSIRLVLTDTAANFLADQSLEQPPLSSLLPLVDAIYLNSDEWALPWTRGAPILHIELRRWADLLVIAPLSANALSKICAGAADDLLTCVVRAWDTSGRVDGRKKGIVVAPAMNTAMWEHPVTMEQVRRLEGEWGDWFEVLKPVEKGLACGDVGGGAMRDWKEVVAVIERRLEHVGEREEEIRDAMGR